MWVVRIVGSVVEAACRRRNRKRHQRLRIERRGSVTIVVVAVTVIAVAVITIVVVVVVSAVVAELIGVEVIGITVVVDVIAAAMISNFSHCCLEISCKCVDAVSSHVFVILKKGKIIISQVGL